MAKRQQHRLAWKKHHGLEGPPHSTAGDYTITHHHARHHVVTHHPDGRDGKHHHVGTYRHLHHAKKAAHAHHKKRKLWIGEALGIGRHRYGLAAHGYTPKLHHHRRHLKSVRVGSLHKGELHRALHVPEGEKIPMAKLRKAAHAGGHIGKRARLAITLRGFKHHKGPRRKRRRR